MAYLVQQALVLPAPRIGADLQQSVAQFLYHEAWCMDENRYDDWLALWEKEMAYWVPIGAEDHDPLQTVSVIHDNRAQAEQRIARLKSRLAYAQQPKSRMVRVLSNVVVVSAQDDVVVATSTFTLGEYRSDHQEIYLGRNLHVLASHEGAFRIREKKVSLVNSESALGNLTFLV